MKIIRSNLFDSYPEVLFSFSTKQGGVSPEPYNLNLGLNTGDDAVNVQANRKLFFDAVGITSEEVSFQKQIHSATVRYSSAPGHLGECDALYTDISRNYLAVSVADCVPVFIYEPLKKVVAGIHSGWKGSAGKILTAAIEELTENFGAEPSGMIAYIGPCISGKNYEVGPKVAELFEAEFVTQESGRYFLDLRKHNYSQLIKCGLHADNIEVSAHCTFDEKDLFHSYRRDREKSGRMLGVIGLRD